MLTLFRSGFGLQVAAYDKPAGKMAFFDPSRKDDFLFISGTKVGLPSVTQEQVGHWAAEEDTLSPLQMM